MDHSADGTSVGQARTGNEQTIVRTVAHNHDISKIDW